MANQISTLSDTDLVGAVVALEREIVTARFAHSMGKLENTASLKGMRRKAAQYQTEARRREVVSGLSKGSFLNGSKAAILAATSGSEASSSDGFLKGIVDKMTADD